jgi:predicted O-methyltransferase YrrM
MTVGKSFVHFVLHSLNLQAAQTQTTAAERECLGRLAQGRTRLAEIGVFEGAGTRVLADAAAPNGRVFAIDPFMPGRLGVCWTRPVALREVAKSAGAEKVEFVRKFSFDAATELQGPFDFVFVDGDHSLGGIARDWQDWSEKIVAGGIIALHDTRVPDHDPSVANLGSHQFFESDIRRDPRFALLEQVDSLSVLQRL